jgi:hypothetical protein
VRKNIPRKLARVRAARDVTGVHPQLIVLLNMPIQLTLTTEMFAAKIAKVHLSAFFQLVRANIGTNQFCSTFEELVRSGIFKG